MRALISLILSSMMLNMSVNAGSSTQAERDESAKESVEMEQEKDAGQKQKMEETSGRITYPYRVFEKSPDPDQRIQTKKRSEDGE